MEKTFVDSNVLIYSRDNTDGRKQRVAQRVLEELWTQGTGTLSIQVLQEFYSTVTRTLKPPVPKEYAREVVEDYLLWCGQTTTDEVKAALRIEDESRINFWDALIVACARRNGATRILSEDMNSGQSIAGILIVNPFSTP